jgi:hypothetical protein
MIVIKLEIGCIENPWGGLDEAENRKRPGRNGGNPIR